MHGVGSGNPPQVSGYVKFLLKQFPHVQAVFPQLLEKNETLRELCEQYEACNEAAERLMYSQYDERLQEEFSALSLRLESELLGCISAHLPKDAWR